MASFSLSTASDVFKRKYLKLSENMYNSSNNTTNRIKRDHGFTGNNLYKAIPLSFSGGVGSGSIPTANVADYDQAVISAKKVYATATIDRETIKASMSDEGAFVRGLKEVVKKAVESFNRNDSRIFFGNGDGALGVVDSVSGSNPYVLTIAAGYNEANFEENDLVNIETGNTDPFEITLVDPQSDGTLDVTVNRLSGSQAPAGTDEIFMQNSEDADPSGLELVTDATSSTLYSVTVARRWQSTQKDLSSVSVSIDHMNEVCLEIERKKGGYVNHIVTSYTQYRKLLALHDDLKTYEVGPRYGSDKLKAKFSFNGLSLLTTKGTVPIVPDRFCPPDRVYFLDVDSITRYHRPDFGWMDDDGTVFLRTHQSGTDGYEAYYGGYYENYIPPTCQGRIDGAAV